MTPAVTFTWHHTIPWNCLLAVWNGLVAGQHWNAVRLFLQIVSDPHPHTTTEQIKKGELMNRDSLHTLLTWQGWNIVEGPGGDFRADDPKEDVERWSLVKGVTGNQRATLQSVALLYIAMKPLAVKPRRPGFSGTVPVPTITTAEAEGLERALLAQMQTLRGKSPIRWSEEMWTLVDNQAGRADRKRPGVWNTTPSWQKA
jgi:hypothetical protein